MVFDIIAPTPAEEYEHIGRYMGNVMTTLRLSLGDFDFSILREKESPKALLPKQHIMFWIIWLVMVIASSFIFFNFIIAEVTESYYTVKKDIKALIYKERAGLLAEAEDMMR